MKMFIVATSLLLAGIILIGINYFVTKSAVQELYCALDKISSKKSVSALDEFQSVWTSKKRYFDLTVHYSKLEKVSFALDLLYSSLESDTINDFLHGIRILRSAINEILVFSSFDLSNIL